MGQINKNNPKFQTAHTILCVSGRYILQLRDNKKTISAPGTWSLFGGKIQTGEKPEEAIKREIYEELNIKPKMFRFLWSMDYYSDFEKEMVRTYLFVSDISSVWHDHKLMEGQGVGLFSFEQISNLDIPTVMRETIERFHSQAKET